MSEPVLLVVVIAFMGIPLIAAGIGMDMALNKRIPPHERIRRSFRIALTSVAVLWIFTFFIIPRQWWLLILIVFAVGTGWMWVIGRGGHLFVGVQEKKDEPVTMSATYDNENSTDV
jgi:xanthine/uracil permease